MKEFNKKITFEISVDDISNELLSKIDIEFKYRELVVEAIIGRQLSTGDSDGIGLIFNALRGYTSGVNFKVGDRVICAKGIWGNWDKENAHYKKEVECVVTEVNIHAGEQLTLNYVIGEKIGITTSRADQCTKIIPTCIQEK